MVKVLVWSDFHTSAGYHNSKVTGRLWPDEDPEVPQQQFDADILLILGDMFCADDFRPEEPHNAKNDTARRFMGNLARRIAPQFKAVGYVPANHEYYCTSLSRGAMLLKEAFREHGNTIRFLDNDYMVVDDTVIYGTTLWSSLPNIIIRERAARGIDDYTFIYTDDALTQRLTPLDSHNLHLAAVAKLETFLARCKTDTALMGKKLMVGTHHAPSWRSIHPARQLDKRNHCYATNLEPLILENPHINVWAHGHTHHPVDYMVGSTRIFSNPSGYEDQDSARSFNPHRGVEF